MTSNIVKVTPTEVNIEPVGINKVLGFQGKMIIPLSKIKEVSIDYGIINEDGNFLRLSGTSIFGKTVGAFSKNKVSVYLNINSKEKPLMLKLIGGEFDEMILGVEDPQTIIAEIHRQVPQIIVSNTNPEAAERVWSKSKRTSYLAYNTLIVVDVTLGGIELILTGVSFYLQDKSSKVVENLANVQIGIGVVMVVCSVVCVAIALIFGRKKRIV